MKKILLFAAWMAVSLRTSASDVDPIKGFCIDFNWGEGGPNGFAKPGLWADADPAKHVAWYRALGANVIQTFCVSCNGYAWYKNGAVAEQPGLKYDFLREVVRLGHRDGLRVLGYFCAGSNTKWGREHPDLSYGFPSEPHIPFTDEYLAYLDRAIRGAVGTTGIDGFMLDWLRMPTTRASNGGSWLDCEKKLFTQLMGEPFPGEAHLTPDKMTAYGRKAVDRCWETIRRAAKEINPQCIVWLTCCDINDPHIANSRALRETDWLLNEAGDLQRTAAAKQMIGAHTRLITCLASWNGQDPTQIVPAAQKEGIGLYGFTKPGADSLLPLESILARPVRELKGDEKNLAVLARAFHGASPDSTRTPDGRFVVPANRSALGKPSPEQLAWHAMEIEMFLCLDPCTWQGREYDNHSTPLSAINPTQLDTEQWCRVAESFGAKQILFVAKHTGGFCWWQTDTSDYSIKHTPWKNGKGDVLAELAASCRRHNLRLGIYVYPGDDTWGAPIGSGGRTKDPAKQEDYNKVFRQQLTEVLSRYGEISEVWFDGSCVIEVGDILKRYAPKAVVLQGPHATLRWPGNEAGVSPYPAWQTVKRADAATGVSTALHSDPDGDAWLPMEMDTTLIDHKWFWGPNTDHKLKSLDRLMDIYLKSVGRGGVLLLNSTPDTNGVIPAAHVKRYAEFGREIQRRFGKSLGETNGAGRSVELVLPQGAWVDHVITMEDIREGQRVRGYLIEARVDGAWREVLRGSSIGFKKIDPFPPVKTTRLRIAATESVGEPLIRRFAAFFTDVPVKLSIKSARASSEHETGNFGAMRMIDGDSQTRWGGSNAAGTNAAWVELDLDTVRDLDRIVIHEGWNRIRRFELQARVQPTDAWRTFHTGTRVGDRCEIRFAPVRASQLRWLIHETTDLPTIWEFEVFGPGAHDEPTATQPTAWQQIWHWDRQTVGSDWTTLDLDLSRHIPQVGQYEVEFLQTNGTARLEIQSATVLLEGLEAPQACARRAHSNAFIVTRSQVTEGKGTEKTALRVRARLTGTEKSAGVARLRRVF